MSNSCDIGLMCVPQYPTDNKSTSVQVMACCHQAISSYQSQCWNRFMWSYGITMPQWVNLYKKLTCAQYALNQLFQALVRNYILISTNSIVNYLENNLLSMPCICIIKTNTDWNFKKKPQCKIMSSLRKVQLKLSLLVLLPYCSSGNIEMNESVKHQLSVMAKIICSILMWWSI